MPAVRIDKASFSYKPAGKKRLNSLHTDAEPLNQVEGNGDLPAPTTLKSQDIYYPSTTSERAAFRTGAGKAVTSHQWDVYDFVRTIPIGRVTTYKDVCVAVGGSPRSVGNALRNNPFAPYIPCHRVIASNFFVGGFFGEWGKNDKTGTRCNQKLDLLSSEGVNFTKTGYLVDVDATIWKG
ncbi:putative 6-O-methylguanine DNA methyltransferase, DNA binding domain [Lyophyllum shimeji]|uniref:Methylated-DNA--protein-cysteine methyltransferase n=1 Tax=Lyophyllum shimeji TaxID=47721 RepID=A0A9P3PD20_LYOSH|nr:putative 6-O-methylguanine DNA methyltransferase, DNA binding domain [Lyophyllum shimeji]